MSSTVSAGIYGTEYWIYMARVMATGLERALKVGHIEPDSFPEGVYNDAVKFFDLAMDGFGDKSSNSLPASLHCTSLTASIIVRYAELFSGEKTEQQIQAICTRHQKFINELLTKDEGMPPADRETAKELINFFGDLAKAGETERYLNAVKMRLPDDDVFTGGVRMRNGRLTYG